MEWNPHESHASVKKLEKDPVGVESKVLVELNCEVTNYHFIKNINSYHHKTSTSKIYRPVFYNFFLCNCFLQFPSSSYYCFFPWEKENHCFKMTDFTQKTWKGIVYSNYVSTWFYNMMPYHQFIWGQNYCFKLLPIILWKISFQRFLFLKINYQCFNEKLNSGN